MDQPFAIRCRRISKHYPQFTLRDVDLELAQGTVMGLVGPNGAGKSTILRLVMGLLTPDSGTVEVLGLPMPARQACAKRRIGFVAEDMRLYESETIGFHMAFIKSIFDTWDDAHARQLLRRFDLRPDCKVKGLSHGQRVKATLLLALARRPQLLVFDEPTTGLDPAVRKEVLDEMMNAMEDETRSILFSSHNTQDIEQVCDHIAFVRNGGVAASLDKEEFLDGWRRLRLVGMEGTALPSMTGIRDVQRQGRICTVTVSEYHEGLAVPFLDAGFQVHAIERMTLEEIFVSIVQAAKTAPHLENAS